MYNYIYLYIYKDYSFIYNININEIDKGVYLRIIKSILSLYTTSFYLYYTLINILYIYIFLIYTTLL